MSRIYALMLSPPNFQASASPVHRISPLYTVYGVQRMNPLTKILSFADEVEDMRERGYDVTDEREVNETWRHLMSGDVKTVVGYYWLNDEDVGLRQFACMSNGSKYSLKSLERHWIQVVNAQPVTELGEKQ